MRPKRLVLSCERNDDVDSQAPTEREREFQMRGALEQKARDPVRVRIRGTKKTREITGLTCA